jgi:hypothetical protein
MVNPRALISSIASRAPLSLSFPRCACGPVSGATDPSLTITSPAAVLGGFFSQAETRIAAMVAARANPVEKR